MQPDWFKHYPKGVKTEIDFSRFQSVAAMLEDTCDRFGHQPALTCMDATITFRQLNRMAEDFASYLQNDVGLKKGDRLAIMLPNFMQFPVAFFAAQKIGVICVNTNPLYTPREMLHQFKDSGVTAIVIVDLFLDKLELILKDTGIKTVIATSAGDQLPFWKGTIVDQVMRFKGMIPKHNLQTTSFKQALKVGRRKPLKRVSLDHRDVCLLQYTGGTTGVSKGAMLTQKNILADALIVKEWALGAIEEGSETALAALPLYHIFALTVNFICFCGMGHHMILVPKPVPIKNTVKMFEKYRITTMTGVNTLFNSLSNDKDFQRVAPRSIKFAIAGGMALQEAVALRWQQITGNIIVQGYGLTEASPVTHCNPLDGGVRVGAIGVPLPSTLAKVVDENGEEVPIGETGELMIQGPQVMLGYWQRPDETAKCLKDNWLKTGDVAKRDGDGFFYIVDRKKDLIVVSGFKVFPNEVEAVLAMHPKIIEAAVVGIPDPNSGEAVKAYIVAKDKTLTVEEVRRFCQEQLTGYKRPRHFEFRDELPKTNVGKILRKDLRDNPEKIA